MMKTELENFDRIHIFNHYHAMTNPFAFVTLRVDVTKLYQLCKRGKSHYATIGYYVVKTINEIDNFKYRYENGKIYKYDKIDANFTQMFKNKNIGYFRVNMCDDLNSFLDVFKEREEDFLNSNQSVEENDQAEVWLSCEPWFHFTGLIPPFNKEVAIPQIIWDQFTFEGDKCYLNFMIMVHHGFADGYNLGMFFHTLEELIEQIDI